MPENRTNRYIRAVFYGRVYQNLAIIFCILFGLSIAINVELAGNPVWFWYATLFHDGAKLYADLHLTLQPLFVLEINAWMRLAGNKALALEVLSVIHVVGLCLGLQLLIRESDWPDWQKGILLASSFVVFTHFTAYLFDDFHVQTDIFWILSFVLLLQVAKAETAQRLLGLAAALGVLSGVTITLRLNDGGALLAGTGVCLPFLARSRKLVVASLFVAAAALTAVLIVKLTGDTFSAYVTNGIVKAAGSKGGTGSFLMDPILVFRNALRMRFGRTWLLLWVLAFVVSGHLMQHYWKVGTKYIVVVQLGIAELAYIVSSPYHRLQLLSGELIPTLSYMAIVVSYVIVLIVAVRYWISKTKAGRRTWDVREILVVPIFFWYAAASTSSAGRPDDFFEIMALLLVLIVVIRGEWAQLSLITIFLLMDVTAVAAKVKVPYAWLTYVYPHMFENRVWYTHPIYGPMYMERDQLQFILPICKEIGQGNSKPELLSLPFPYPNYFCDIPPWHGYVQTWFDLSTRSTIDRLMSELDTAPPHWIVYQRQLEILVVHERIFNHGQPLAQRDLDEMIMNKIATGQWQVVDKSDYLFTNKRIYQEGDGWLLIRTRPQSIVTAPAPAWPLRPAPYQSR